MTEKKGLSHLIDAVVRESSNLIRETKKRGIRSGYFTEKYYKAPGLIYYRGQKTSYGLIPTLLRDKQLVKEKKELLRKENHIYCKSLIMGYEQFRNARNSWEFLAIMQHYGFLTRLLDWTSSLLNAVFFSIADCIDCKKKCYELKGNNTKSGSLCKEDEKNISIWILSPRILHWYNKIENIGAFTVGIDPLPDYQRYFITSYQKKKAVWPYKKGPVFIEVPWMDSRIKNQKGYFTFHYDHLPMDETCKKSVRQVKIDNDWKKGIIDDINNLGVNAYDIYPDLTALSKHINKLYQSNNI